MQHRGYDSIAVIVGYRTRFVSLLLAGFCVVSALIFRRALGDKIQAALFMKNFASAGGLLLLVARGAGGWSLDALRQALAEPVERPS